MLGVFLDYDSTDFTTNSPMTHRVAGGFRTGLSEAVSSDEADDSYDLAWMGSLSADRDQRLARLRSLLTTETEPISRHYIHELLIGELYRFREKTPDGRRRSMPLRPPTIRRCSDPASAGVQVRRCPVDETLPLAAIRQAKAGDYVKAQWWADRPGGLPETTRSDQTQSRTYRHEPPGTAAADPKNNPRLPRLLGRWHRWTARPPRWRRWCARPVGTPSSVDARAVASLTSAQPVGRPADLQVCTGQFVPALAQVVPPKFVAARIAPSSS